MAKKKGNKPNIPLEALQRARAELADEGVEPVVAPVKSKTKSTPKARKEQAQPVQRVTSFKKKMTREELQEEYGYVVKDLRDTAILAAGLFVAMVVIAFALQNVL